MTQTNLDMPQGFPIREVIRTLFEYGWRMVAVFVSTIAVTILLVFFVLSPKFESKATLIVNSADLVQPLVNSQPQSDFEKVIEFQTQKDVLASVRLAEEVVSELSLAQTRRIGNLERLRIGLSSFKNWTGRVLGVDKWTKPWDPEAAAVSAVTENLAIETAPQSKAIKLSYRSYDPEEAAAVLSALVESYKAYYYAQSTAEADGVLAYLESRIQAADIELLNAEQAILEFRRSTQSSTDGRETGRFSTVDITDSLEVQDEFKLYILRMEEELRLLSQEAPPRDPRVVALQEKLHAFVSAMNQLPDEELELQRLKRTHALAQDKYMLLARNLEQAKLIAMGQTNNLGLISVLEEPEADEDPVSPKRRLILFLSLFLASGLSAVWAYLSRFFDNSIRTPDDLAGLSSLRYLGSLNRIRA